MNQRIWPDENLNIDDFRAAMQQVEQKRVRIRPRRSSRRGFPSAPTTSAAASPISLDIPPTTISSTSPPLREASSRPPTAAQPGLPSSMPPPACRWVRSRSIRSIRISSMPEPEKPTPPATATSARVSTNPPTPARPGILRAWPIPASSRASLSIPKTASASGLPRWANFYAPSSERGVYLSNDGGATWEQKLFIDDTTGGCRYRAASHEFADRLCRHVVPNPQSSESSGRRLHQRCLPHTGRRHDWTRLTDGLPPQANNIGRIGLTLCESNPNVLYAIYANHPGEFMGVFKTTNGGDSWSQTNDDDLFEFYRSFGWYFGNIRVRPDNPDVVFALGVELYRSTNGGSTWTQQAWDIHVDHHAMWFDPSTPTRSLLGNDGGLFRSSNNGNDWTQINGLPINQFYAANVDYQLPQRRYGGNAG